MDSLYSQISLCGLVDCMTWILRLCLVVAK